MANRNPAIVLPPGDFIREEIEARGWTQSDLATILGRPLTAVNQIITGRRAVTPETAKSRAEAFGTSPEFWMNLETQYQLSRAVGPEGAVRARARSFEKEPRKDAKGREWRAAGRPTPKSTDRGDHA